MFAPLVLAGIFGASVASAEPQASLDAYVHNALGVQAYRWAEADLNGDGQAEQFIYASDPRWCGSGGCTLFVLTRQPDGYRTVLRSTVTRLPVRLLPTTSHGWRDLAVGVGGGGDRADAARLSFDGKAYPGNPTLAPRLSAADTQGDTILGIDSTRQGAPVP